MSWESGACAGTPWRVRVGPEGVRTPATHPAKCLFLRGHLLNREIPSSPSRPDSQTAFLEELAGRSEPLQCCRQAEGDASFALWNREGGRLIVAADRLGLHPLYYVRDGSGLVVSWDLSDLIPFVVPARFDRTSLTAQLAGFLLPEGRTFYESIRRVPAGMMLAIDESGFRLHRYWTLEDTPVQAQAGDEACVEALKGSLSSVHSDWLRVLGRPLGITLSSGMDSSSVAASIRRVEPASPVRAFSWVHPELPSADESAGIREVCRRLELDLTRLESDQTWTLSGPAGLETSREGPEAHYYRESWEMTFQAAASRGHRSLFSGVGGDELFGGGISSYPDRLLAGRWVSLARQLAQERRNPDFGLRYLYRTVFDAWLRNRFPAWDRRRMRLPAWLTRATLEEALEMRLPPVRFERGDLGRQLRIRFLQNLTRNRQALLVSRMARRFGLEMIHPLLDRRLVELAARLPSSQSWHAGMDKVILRRALQDSLPASILRRRRKITVEALFHRGFRERETDKVWPLLRNMRSAEIGLLDEVVLRDQYRLYLNGQVSGQMIWSAVVVEDWLRRYF